MEKGRWRREKNPLFSAKKLKKRWKNPSVYVIIKQYDLKSEKENA